MRINRISMNVEYAGMQGCYWMLYCAAVSYAAVFLLQKGYSTSEIGIILAVGNIMAFLLQPAVADFADRARKINLLQIIWALCAVSFAVLFAVLFAPAHSVMLTASFVALLLLSTVLQPLTNSLCFFLEKWGVHINFGVARALGSFAYAVISAVIGILVDHFGVISAPITGLAVMLLYFALLFVITLQGKHRQKSNEPAGGIEINYTEDHGGIVPFLKKYKGFPVFLGAVALLFFTHSMINSFYIQIVTEAGGNSGDMGMIFSFTALLEMPAMMLLDRILRKIKISYVIAFAMISFTVKALAVALADSVFLLYLAQLFQAISFALFIPASVRFVNEMTDTGDGIKGQAFITAMITLGTIFSSVAGGILFDKCTARTTLMVGTAISAVGSVVGLASLFEISLSKKPCR